MPDASRESPLETFCHAFESHGVEYVVIGGQAEFLHGSERMTFDYDFCYRRTPDNIRRLAAALRQFSPALRVARVREPLPFQADAPTLQAGCNFTFATGIGDLDLLGYVEPLGGYEEIRKRAEIYEIGDLRLPVIALDDLIRVKRHILRPKDRESLLHLDALRVQREQARRRATSDG